MTDALRFKKMLELNKVVTGLIRTAKDQGMGYQELLSTMCAGIDKICDEYELDYAEIHERCYKIAKEIHRF